MSKQPQLAGWRVNQKYPLLYLHKEKVRLWACWVKGNVVYRTDGLLDGKLKDPQEHRYTANNIRSASEQAQQEAEKMWIKQMDKGYLPAADDKLGQQIYSHVRAQKEANGGMNRGVKMFAATEICSSTTAGKKDLDDRHLPMLAKHYREWKDEEFQLSNPSKNLKFPAICQPKLDGIRVLPMIKGNQVILESRNGNNFMYLQHIRDEVKKWLKEKNCSDLILDGELYVHRLYRDDKGKSCLNSQYPEMKSVERYQFVSEACKVTRKKAHEYEHLIQFWVFDIWDPNRSNLERYHQLQSLFEGYKGKLLQLVPTKIVNSHQEIEKYMAQMVGETRNREGYEFEGIMVRSSEAKYMASTTHQSCLLKYKRFEDEEWEISGAEQCVGGTQDGAVKWKCKKVVGKKMVEVVAKQIGDTERNKKLYSDYCKNPKKFLGRMINLRFNERSKDGVPRFPRATAFVTDK